MEEGEKRKQDDNDVVSKSAMKKPKEETELKEEEEVEEFFAILRRIKIAVKYFNKVDGASGSDRGGCDERKMTNDIDRKCIDEIIGDNEEIKEKEKNKLGFDLNMKPYDPHEEDT
ncbi:hypothetical protein BC332_27279 [Capsicum chinense]|nr:hypothetical protein BC332_27279 [Capsicum chinense]